MFYCGGEHKVRQHNTTQNNTEQHMKLNNTNCNGGFTLVEIMIVVGIIGIVAAIGVPNFLRYREASRRSVCIANLKKMQEAKTQWAFEKGKKATDIPVTADLCGSEQYLREKPSCPGGGADYVTTIGQVDQTASCTLARSEGHTLAVSVPKEMLSPLLSKSK